MSYVDLTSAIFTEVDGGGDIVRSTTSVTVTSHLHNVTGYVYGNYGSGYFKNFIHKHELYHNSSSVLTTGTGVWGISNSITDVRAHETGNIDSIFIYIDDGLPDITLVSYGATAGTDMYVSSLNTRKYLTTRRYGNVVTCNIYSDSARTSLLDTISVSCNTTKYQYFYPYCGYNFASGARSFTGYTQNFTLYNNVVLSSETYDFNPDCLESISYNDTRDVELVSSWSNDYYVSDKGLNSKNITLSGIQYTDPFVSMCSLMLVQESGDVITFQNMKNTNLNTTWVMESFSYERISPDAVMWNITFEKK